MGTFSALLVFWDRNHVIPLTKPLWCRDLTLCLCWLEQAAEQTTNLIWDVITTQWRHAEPMTLNIAHILQTLKRPTKGFWPAIKYIQTAQGFTKPHKSTLQRRHNECDCVSNHQRLDCLLNPLFRRRSKKPSKPHVTGNCERNPPVTDGFPSKRASNVENDDITMLIRLFSNTQLCGENPATHVPVINCHCPIGNDDNGMLLNLPGLTSGYDTDAFCVTDGLALGQVKTHCGPVTPYGNIDLGQLWPK